MGIAYLIPDGDNTIELTRSGGAANYEMIDDPVGSPDDNTTYNTTAAAAGFKRDLYDIPSHGTLFGTVTNVRVYIRCRSYANGNACYCGILQDGTEYYGNANTINNDGSYHTFYYDWASRPSDSQPWTWADIDALVIGVKLNAISNTCRATQVYAEITYDLSNVFITEWETENLGGTGSSLTKQVKIPTNSAGTYDCTVYWGDGSSDYITTYNDAAWTHTYAAGGTKTVMIDGTFYGFNFANPSTPNGDYLKLTDIIQWGDMRVGNTGGYFNNCTNLVGTFTDNLDLTGTTTLREMFKSCVIFNGDITGWDTSGITNMYETFRNAQTFNQDISGWDVSNVTSMAGLFSGAYDFNQDISGWDVSNNHYFDAMFTQATDFNQDISGWDTSAAWSMHRTFYYASSFNQDLSSWDTTWVSSFSYMFKGATAFNHFEGIETWNITSITQAIDMFKGKTIPTLQYTKILCAWAAQSVKNSVTFSGGNSKYYNSGQDARDHLTGTHLWTITDGGLDADAANTFYSEWNTENTSTGSTASKHVKFPLEADGTYDFTIFWGDGTFDDITVWNDAAVDHTYTNAGTYNIETVGTLHGFRFNNTLDKLKILDIMQWGTGFRLGNNNGYFYGCTNLTGTFTDDLDMTGTTTFYYAFYNCTNFNGDLSGIDTSNVTNMRRTFWSCTNFNQDLGSWDVSSVTSMEYMFYYCNNFNQDLNSWDVSNVNNMYAMFTHCVDLNQDFDNWDVTAVTDMRFMFQYCSDFNGDISTWHPTAASSMYCFLNGCHSFNQPMDTFDVHTITDFSAMFMDCPLFNQSLNNWDTSKAVVFTSMFRDCDIFNGNISDWDTGKLKYAGYMFYSAAAFNQPLNNWNTSTLKDTGDMFRYATSFNQPLDKWDTHNIEDSSYMFYGATNFIGVGLENWDMSKNTNMDRMFYNSAFNRNLRNWNVSKVAHMTNAFKNTNLAAFRYSAMLVAWDALPTLVNGVRLDADPTKYNATVAGAARADLIATYGWTINDGGALGGTYVRMMISWDTGLVDLPVYHERRNASLDFNATNLSFRSGNYASYIDSINDEGVTIRGWEDSEGLEKFMDLSDAADDGKEVTLTNADVYNGVYIIESISYNTIGVDAFDYSIRLKYVRAS